MMRKLQTGLVFLLLNVLTARLCEPVPIEIEGNTYFSDKYLSDFLTRKGSRDIESAILTIISRYNDAGYPFCRIVPTVVYDDSARPTRIVLRVQEGDHVTITDYIYCSSGRTSSSILKRFAGGKTNIPFSLRRVDSIKRKLTQTDIFEMITNEIVQQDDRYYLRFDMRERKSDFIALLGSYGKEDLNISAKVSTRNLLGTLRGLQFTYEHDRTFSLLYHDPVTVIPIAVDGEFLLLTEDSMRLTEFGARVTVPITQLIDLGISSGHESASNEIDTSASYRSNYAGLTAILHHQRDQLSLKSNADFDYLFRTVDRKRFSYDGSIDFGHLLIAFHYRFVWTDSFSYFDYYRIGGANDLRGFREDEFFARKARWFSLEYHRLPIFPMIDIGYVNDDFLYSYGFGLNAGNRLATATLIIAWPGAGNWREGKVHLLLTAGF